MASRVAGCQLQASTKTFSAFPSFSIFPTRIVAIIHSFLIFLIFSRGVNCRQSTLDLFFPSLLPQHKIASRCSRRCCLHLLIAENPAVLTVPHRKQMLVLWKISPNNTGAERGGGGSVRTKQRFRDVLRDRRIDVHKIYYVGKIQSSLKLVSARCFVICL